MTRLAKAIAAAAVLTAAALAFSSVAGAVGVDQDSEDYPSEQCTADVNGVTTVVPCDPEADVLGITQGPAVAAAAVSTSGTLPYTGNQSTFPLVQVGVALLAGGGVVLMVVKNRQAASAS